MELVATPIPGLTIVETRRIADPRGWFQRLFDKTVFDELGGFEAVQISQSHNSEIGTLRGMHFQNPPHAETKLVRCLHGTVFDVAVDLRPDSPTRWQWHGVELSGDNQKAFLIPKGFAHGFITLSDDVDLLYMTDHPWTKEAEGGLRYDDPAIGIEWPREPTVVSDRDQSFAYLKR